MRITAVAFIMIGGPPGQSTGVAADTGNPLTGQPRLLIVPAMYGLNQICGICREIIR
jgi:hypothetical protein